ncbi:hypothetical protein [Algoriphagus machipongonensis]|uniref:Uncharacterized protein n=1 Tax=Algoriphagus machipongonensis TaxID=388413 RepID=A3HV97_9BACT|nr:hypothetical protein [Algoriphagus machipongonensis]EAZ82069.1 hypothetical protein ALPR1_02470 [Algoriphagus machipongonensis]
MAILDIIFDGYFQCRLATDPDPSNEQRGISGFTYSVAGETLLDPSIWSQAKDIEKAYGPKEECFKDPLRSNTQFDIKNIREASPDYSNYNSRGIGILVKEVQINGETVPELNEKMKGALCRFANRPKSNGPYKGPIFEGRNQITSDGDPDRFTVNPFLFTINTPDDSKTVISRFDPLDMEYPDKQLYEVFPNTILDRRLPYQRFALSTDGLAQIGLTQDDLNTYFQNRMVWLKSKIVEAEAINKPALAEAYRSRLYAVNFFTQATGPTVLANRLLSRIPLRQLYRHTIRGNSGMEPTPIADQEYFGPYQIDTEKDWEILYYLGQYDGDLMAGWCSGTLSIPLKD